MAKREEIDDLDTLIEEAVDTYFVEASSKAEEPPKSPQAKATPPSPKKKDSAPEKAPPNVSLDEAVDSLFMSSFEPSPAPLPNLRQPTTITSGDVEIDQAIDLAVDTLFVEEPETPPPETAQLRVADSQQEDQLDQYLAVEQSYADRIDFAGEARPAAASAQMKRAEQARSAYDDVMALEISRHMHTLYDETAKEEAVPEEEPQERMVSKPPTKQLYGEDAQAVRKLQEAILTLEWEVSRRSVTALATELHRVRTRFQDNVTVDFAAMSMRVVLDYVVKRMARAHPESVRFLLEVTEFLERILVSPEEDPLRSFHQILTRYERYKSVVRKAEGLPDRRPAILGDLEIKDPAFFAKLVDAHASTLVKASHSLENGLKRVRDPENLIRSFRFLVTRSFNRILEKTHKQKEQGRTKGSAH